MSVFGLLHIGQVNLRLAVFGNILSSYDTRNTYQLLVFPISASGMPVPTWDLTEVWLQPTFATLGLHAGNVQNLFLILS